MRLPRNAYPHLNGQPDTGVADLRRFHAVARGDVVLISDLHTASSLAA